MPMTTRTHLLTALALVALSALQPFSPSAFSQHPFVCADYTGGKIFIVSAAGKIEWEYPAPKSNDLWILANGNLLFTTGTGVKEIARATSGTTAQTPPPSPAQVPRQPPWS